MLSLFQREYPQDYIVLIVDDSVSVVKYLEHVINKKAYGNFTIHTAFTGLDALELAEKITPDVVFLDISLPQMDGLVVCNKLRKMFPQIPIIIITAELSIENRLKAFEEGATDYIIKPFSSDQIVEHMATHLRNIFEKKMLINGCQ